MTGEARRCLSGGEDREAQRRTPGILGDNLRRAEGDAVRSLDEGVGMGERRIGGVVQRVPGPGLQPLDAVARVRFSCLFSALCFDAVSA